MIFILLWFVDYWYLDFFNVFFIGNIYFDDSIWFFNIGVIFYFF